MDVTHPQKPDLQVLSSLSSPPVPCNLDLVSDTNHEQRNHNNAMDRPGSSRLQIAESHAAQQTPGIRLKPEDPHELDLIRTSGPFILFSRVP